MENHRNDGMGKVDEMKEWVEMAVKRVRTFLYFGRGKSIDFPPG